MKIKNKVNIKKGHPRFYEIIEELAELHSAKNSTYASQENPLGNFIRSAKLSEKIYNPKIKNKPLAQALVLMAKQIDAVYDIVGEGKENLVESLEDKFRDIAVYSILCIVLMEDVDKYYKDKLI